MRGVDERPEVLGAAVAGIGSIRQHPIVAPVAASAEIRDRHYFDGGDAKLGELSEFLDRRPEAALRGEGAQMQFVENGVLPRQSVPLGLPAKRGVDQLARTVDVVRLEARGRIGNAAAVRQFETIADPGDDARQERFVETVARGLHRLRFSTLDAEPDARQRGRPQSELGAGRFECRAVRPGSRHEGHDAVAKRETAPSTHRIGSRFRARRSIPNSALRTPDDCARGPRPRPRV